MSAAAKMLAKMAKDRENFEKKKAELAAEMSNSKNNMSRIKKGEAAIVTETEVIPLPLQQSPSSKNKKDRESGSFRKLSIKSPSASSSSSSSSSTSSNNSNNNNDNNLNLIIPTGTRVSDWCFVSALDSTPPVVKSNEVYEILRLLGRGAYGDVNLVKNIEDNKFFAMKTMYYESQREADMTDALSEVRFLRQHRHACIIDIMDCFITAKPRILHIVMPSCEAGDIASMIISKQNSKTFIPEPQLIKWIIQIGLALLFLHESATIHRDLKPNNVMLTEGGDQVKLIDFGLAVTLPDGVCRSSVEAGTPYYTPPCMVQGQPYSFPVDCWALGVMVYECCALTMPFHGRTTADLVQSILTDEVKALPPQYSQDLNNIVRALLNKDPKKRLGMAGLLSDATLAAKVSAYPAQYRPKALEERLKRSHARQLAAQIEAIPRSKNSSLASVLDCIPIPIGSPPTNTNTNSISPCPAAAAATVTAELPPLDSPNSVKSPKTMQSPFKKFASPIPASPITAAATATATFTAVPMSPSVPMPSPTSPPSMIIAHGLRQEYVQIEVISPNSTNANASAFVGEQEDIEDNENENRDLDEEIRDSSFSSSDSWNGDNVSSSSAVKGGRIGINLALIKADADAILLDAPTIEAAMDMASATGLEERDMEIESEIEAVGVVQAVEVVQAEEVTNSMLKSTL